MPTHADKLAAALRAVLPAATANALRPSTLADAGAVLAEHDAHAFAAACHELADRARTVRANNPGLRPVETHALARMEELLHWVGDNADCAPDLYAEPTA